MCFPKLRQTSDPESASGWTRFEIVGKLSDAENLHLKERGSPKGDSKPRLGHEVGRGTAKARETK
jgi:hypothetical protein